MAKQIVFTYEDKEYTLEFTRRTVKQMEDEGFVAQDIDRKPMIAPAVDTLIDKFAALLNIVNQFFARLSGATTFTKAKKAAASYGDSISGAGKSAKKAAKDIKDATRQQSAARTCSVTWTLSITKDCMLRTAKAIMTWRLRF